MAQKMQFTKARIEALEPVPGKRITVYDEGQKGLCIRITPAGAKAFYCVRKVEGRVEWIRIGGADAVKIEAARARAAEIINDIARGINPAEQKRKKKAEMAFSDLFAAWLKDGTVKGKKSLGNDDRNFRLHLQSIAQKKLSDITREHLRKLHCNISTASGKYQANRVLELISAVFNFGINVLDMAGINNPAAGIKANREESRERRLHPDEMPRFFEALATEPNRDMRDYFVLSLLTGARRSNLLAMTWTEVNLVRKTWTIPGPKAKSGDTITVPLTTAAIEVLENRKDIMGGKGWVFPGNGKTGHLVEPKTAWKRLLQRADIEDLRLHDLRRSLASFQIDAGVSLAVIGKGLGHHSQQTTAVYARLAQDPVADAWQKGTDAIMIAADLKKTAEVLPMKKTRSHA
ncbi:MAG: tyrosine-type recombinase/integrase [Acidithiobacillus ferriphilus]|jgi:integrase|uniref:tyrosine-type recombinase/integrase n=1 Tax=Acidithiobacillus ferriphilus TaxID=1689834 RepID=UPI00242CFC49|nr:site-specific integrase [Acidithiobacillus ferriphilus]MBW9250346.1 tyrosine-type recombinase/integrase [Acidithiobacillus ferriphilus]MBW9255779.1 tyrosine-type recombinase/integrase [Acidithiobacillus ferriphilus]